jgi:hypothetical protein
MDLVRFLILNVVYVPSEKLTPSSSTPSEQEKRFNKRIIFICPGDVGSLCICPLLQLLGRFV